MNELLFAIWFFLPAAFANVVPIFLAVIPGLKRFDAPLDGGRLWHGRAILGSHKTWRGLIGGMIFATTVLWIQQECVAHFDWAQTLTARVDYVKFPTLILGPLFGLGALGGDAIKSFAKRRRNIEAGRTWIPFDQLDYVLGGLIASLPIVVLPLFAYIWIVIIWFAIHLLSSYIGWLVGLKEQPI